MDRLRRLDALFAERVLGHDIFDWTEQPVHGVDYWSRMVAGPLPKYTRRLDLAWEGATEYREVAGPFAEDGLFRATTYTDEPTPFVGTADHPAEALVLACLRAVGCSEEELQ